MKVMVAMSGGVDSSVAAALMVDAGHDVTGIHLRLSDTDGQPGADGRQHGCCGITDADDARRVAQVLDIPFYVWNLKDVFAEGVIDDFIDEYERGRTPNPCVRCNEKVKFGALQARALDIGFDAIATGHYAQVSSTDGVYHLSRAVDTKKDQSYVLARLGQSQLAHALFPIGGMTKEQTREAARALSLRTADKPESFDICFVNDGDAAGFVESKIGARPGQIVTAAGEVIGQHDGVHRFTVGQRRGLGVDTAERTYVVSVDAPTNRIIVGTAEMLMRKGLIAEQVRWSTGAVSDLDSVQVRAHGEPIPARVRDADGDAATIDFDTTARGIAPGQLVAFYRGEQVVGGGTINASF